MSRMRNDKMNFNTEFSVLSETRPWTLSLKRFPELCLSFFLPLTFFRTSFFFPSFIFLCFSYFNLNGSRNILKHLRHHNLSAEWDWKWKDEVVVTAVRQEDKQWGMSYGCVENTNLKRSVAEKPHNKNSPRRLRCPWKDHIKMSITNINCKYLICIKWPKTGNAADCAKRQHGALKQVSLYWIRCMNLREKKLQMTGDNTEFLQKKMPS